MTLDLVIVSHSKNEDLQNMTQAGINMALASQKLMDIYPIVIEGNPNVCYNNAKTYHQYGDFGYNKFLNYGASLGSSEYIAFCNNDLSYRDSWALNLIYAMIANNIDSVSPYSNISHVVHNTGIKPFTGLHYGYKVKHQFEGWCFVWRRKLWEQMPLDERITFWCSDDATAEQLKAAGKTHALVTNAIVDHPDNGGKTLKTAPNRHELTIEQAKIFNRLYDKNVENAGK